MVGPVYRVARARRHEEIERSSRNRRRQSERRRVEARRNRRGKQNAAIWRKNLVNEETAGEGIYNDG